MGNDMVNHPSHYNFGDIETIEIIKDMGPVVMYGFMIGNAIKYEHRALHKGKTVEDLKKAMWYVEHLIKYLEYECDQTRCATALATFTQMLEDVTMKRKRLSVTPNTQEGSYDAVES